MARSRKGVLLPLLAAGALVCSPSASADSAHGVPFPRGTQLVDGERRSGRGFRQTVRYYSRFIRRRGIAAERVPTYQHRGVTVSRILSKSDRAPFAAIHIYRHRGVTWIYVVPARPPLTSPK